MQKCLLCHHHAIHHGTMTILKRDAATQVRERTFRYTLWQACFESSGRTSRVRKALMARDKARSN
jgi:hypothetical protein